MVVGTMFGCAVKCISSLFAYIYVLCPFLHDKRYFMWIASRKKNFEHAQICGFRTSYARVKYHPGLCSPFIHSVVFNDSVSRQ